MKARMPDTADATKWFDVDTFEVDTDEFKGRIFRLMPDMSVREVTDGQ